MLEDTTKIELDIDLGYKTRLYITDEFLKPSEKYSLIKEKISDILKLLGKEYNFDFFEISILVPQQMHSIKLEESLSKKALSVFNYHDIKSEDVRNKYDELTNILKKSMELICFQVIDYLTIHSIRVFSKGNNNKYIIIPGKYIRDNLKSIKEIDTILKEIFRAIDYCDFNVEMIIKSDIDESLLNKLKYDDMEISYSIDASKFNELSSRNIISRFRNKLIILLQKKLEKTGILAEITKINFKE